MYVCVRCVRQTLTKGESGRGVRGETKVWRTNEDCSGAAMHSTQRFGGLFLAIGRYGIFGIVCITAKLCVPVHD